MKIKLKYPSKRMGVKMSKCPKTVSGKHIWGSEIITYTIISKDELQPNVLLKCKACGLYDDVNVPTANGSE